MSECDFYNWEILEFLFFVETKNSMLVHCEDKENWIEVDFKQAFDLYKQAIEIKDSWERFEMENKAKGEIKKTIVYALYDFYKMKKNKIDSQFYYNYINRWADGLEETIRKIVKDGIQIKLKSELEPEPEPEPEPARAGKGISAVILGMSDIQNLLNRRV